MARIIDYFGPTQRMQEEKWASRRKEIKRRMEMLGSGPGQFSDGPEFSRAKALYGKLGSLGMPEDIGGVGDLNAAERAGLVEQQEMIGGQLGTGEEELRNLVGRMGGGGSEMMEAAEGMRVGAIGARSAALRGALQGGQQRVETRRGEALRGKEVAAGGFGGLAGIRESGMQWRGGQNMQRQQMLLQMMGDMGMGSGSAIGGGSDVGYKSTGGLFDPNRYGTSGFSRDLQATGMRNQFVWPTQYGRKDPVPPPRRGAYSYA